MPCKTVRYGAFLTVFPQCGVTKRVKEMVFSTYKQQRILVHYSHGYKAPTIAKLLQEENLRASRVGIAKFLKKFNETGYFKGALGLVDLRKYRLRLRRSSKNRCELMMKRQRCSYTVSSGNAATTCPCGQFFAVGRFWDGHFVVVPTVSSFET